MKKLIFISAILLSWIGCNQTDIPLKRDITDKNYKGVEVPKYSDKHNLNYWDHYNGYGVDECVDGTVYYNDYHKILFKGWIKDYVTKKAYSTYMNRDPADWGGGPYPPDIVLRYFDEHVFVNIRNDIEADLLKKETKKWVQRTEKNNSFILIMNKIIYKIYTADLLTKSEYDKWMKKHPKTRILKY